mgnify:CR=1 FL=1
MDNRSFKNALILSIAQAILGSQMPIYIILGGLVGQSLSQNICFSTLPISLLIIGSGLVIINIGILRKISTIVLKIQVFVQVQIEAKVLILDMQV